MTRAPADRRVMPAELDLTPVTRRPCRLAAETLRWAETLRAEDLDWGPVRAQSMLGASIVVVTYNNLAVTKLCLQSIAEHRGSGGFELVIVDNASTDGTREFLEQVRLSGGPVKVVFNDSNRGFAPANNQGLREARGDVLVLLNNDTLVTPGWLDALTRHARAADAGLVGPVTNRIGNEADVETDYRTYGGMIAFAERYTRGHAGQTFEIPTLCMFCLAMRRQVYERLGPIDERYHVGMLEDDDYSARAREAGLRLACAEDVFVHHFGQASFGELWSSGEYQALLDANTKRFAEKWGYVPAPYARRRGERYGGLIERVRSAVERVTPAGAIVAVVSKGDEELLRFRERTGWHFLRGESGEYAGFNPADSEAAIAQVESLRRAGAGFLVVPATAMWWLEHYAGFSDHLRCNARQVQGGDDCVIFALSGGAA